MRVLVTGGSGFIGSHLINRLENDGHEVFNVDIHAKIPVDIRIPHKVKNVFEKFRPEIVFHLAALASVPLCEKHVDRAYKTNVLGSLNVIKASSTNGARLIFSSSAAVYGNPKVIPTPEETPLEPFNHYGLTKVVVECLCRQYLRDYLIFRIFNAYGPQCKRSYVVSDTIRKIMSGKNPVRMSGTGEEARDFVYISDVIDAFCIAMKHDTVGTYNLGTGISTKIRVLTKKISEIIGRNICFKFGSKMRIGDFMINQASMDKVRNTFKWKPLTTLDIGLKKTIKEFIKGVIN